MKRRTRLSLSLREAVHRDYVALNNTVVVEGMLITPVLMAATSFKNAAAVILASVIIILPTTVIDKIASKVLPAVLRWPVCVFLSALFTVPSYYLTAFIFPAVSAQIYTYNMLLMADAVFIASFRDKQKSSLYEKFQDVLSILLGFALVSMILGIIREILGSGSINGKVFLLHAPLPFVNNLAGGMMVLALLAAIMQIIRQTYLASRIPSGKDAGEI